MADSKQKYDFSQFKIRVKPRVPLSERAYYRGYTTANPVREDFTIQYIEEIIRSGDVDTARELSRYYYRTNSEYHNNIDFLAYLPTYDTGVIPVYQEGKIQKEPLLKAFDKACKFIDNLDIPNTLAHITKEWIKTGVYYGILREDGAKVVIQDLPVAYCRSRFKDFDNLNILEFNLHYFEHINDEKLREESLKTFPKEIQTAWRAWYKTRKLIDPWVTISGAIGGICFKLSDDDAMPLLLASIPELKKLQDAVGREERRDENEMYKILIQRMPIDSKGELVFQLDEVADIHASVAEMLADNDTVEVLTTFGETTLENLQDSSAATQSADRVAKYKTNAFDALGRSSLLFNAEGSAALAYAIKKDEALVRSYLNIYEHWLKVQLNRRFAKSTLTFDVVIMPTTVFNRKDILDSYFRGAQYGYSKILAGVAMGIPQMDQLSLMNFENEILGMTDKMLPLQSSYTTSGTGEKNQVSKGNTGDLSSKGGRPELPDEQKSEKTQANIAAAQG